MTSSQIKRQVLHLIQLENMIKLGYHEYQTYYEEVYHTIFSSSYTQLIVAKSMLEFTVTSRKNMMSEIEKNMYFRSIQKINEIKKERFTAHKELCSK